MRLFDTVSLSLFVAVCDEKSIASAAQQEGIVPSAVSKRISALEDSVGARLLERGRRGVEPTPAGEVLLRYARELLAGMDRMHGELGAFAQGIQGHIRIHASMSAVAEFLQKDIGEFLRHHEQVRVTVVEKVTAEIIRAVEEGRADLGVCWGDVDTRRLKRVPYRFDDLVLAVHRGHPLASCQVARFADIVRYDVVDILVGSIVQARLQKEAAAIGQPLRYRVQVTTFDAACRAVADNLGCAFIPRGLVRESEELRTIPISDAWAHRRFVVCARDDEQLSLPARLLIHSLAASAAPAAISGGNDHREE
jgi:DNA-binding transcriptional LysR family regulator